MTQKRLKFPLGETLVPGLALLFVLAYLIQTKGASLTVMRWPYMILAITALLWLGVIGRYVLKGFTEENQEAFNLRQLLIPALMVVVPSLYLLAMPYLGFALSTLIFLLILFRLLGSCNGKVNFSIALIMTLALHFALIILLHMALPRLEIGSFVL
jgi:hypothetical protein